MKVKSVLTVQEKGTAPLFYRLISILCDGWVLKQVIPSWPYAFLPKPIAGDRGYIPRTGLILIEV
jgi:hypothetical protein